MIIDDLLRLTFSEIMNNKIQSALIVASVAVGIFAIFALNSIGTGLKEEFVEISGKIGSDVAMAFPSSSGFTGFTESFDDQDLREIEAIPLVDRTCPMMFNVETIEGKMYWTAGMTLECYEWMEERGIYDLREGHFGAAVGYIIADDLDLEVNSKVEIKDRNVRVTGILKPVGSEQDDSTIYLTLDEMVDLYGEEEYYTVFFTFSGTQENLEQAFDNTFRDRDVQVQTYEQLMNQVSGLLDTINVAVLGVAFISLIVGAITIANTVYATIRRKTREIGMLKAVGARDRDVMFLFIFETFILSALGGIVGIISGYLVALAVVEVIKYYILFEPSTSPLIIFGSFGVALVIGPLSALVPALYAAHLSPVEALRYE